MIYIQNQQCVGCGACIDACPVGAIQLINGLAVIDQEKCQQCEVCLAVCPNNAIVAVLDQEPVSVIPSLVPMQSQPAAVQYARPTASITPWVSAALVFVGREIIPRVAVTLLEAWDRRARKPTPQGTMPSASPNSYVTPVASGGNRERKHRQRRRGQW